VAGEPIQGGESGERGALRRELHFWEAIALSIAIMAPTAAMALNGVAISGLIGRAVPLAFVFALAGVLFVSEAPYSRFPWIVLAWLAVGGLVVALAPGVARRVGVALTREVES
jgi:hypothetical protein